jgi:hypothetical protein
MRHSHKPHPDTTSKCLDLLERKTQAADEDNKDRKDRHSLTKPRTSLEEVRHAKAGAPQLVGRIKELDQPTTPHRKRGCLIQAKSPPQAVNRTVSCDNAHEQKPLLYT